MRPMLRDGLLVVVVGCACWVPNNRFLVEADAGDAGDAGETHAETGPSTASDATSSGAPTDGTSVSVGSETQSSDTTTDEPLPICGDGQVEGAEQCDDANQTETDACLASCAGASCGDGHVWAGMENCDDGNTIDGDGCPATCLSLSCGDGVKDEDAGEQCDDGNAVDEDECTNKCTLPFCGDGIVMPGEEACDDGNEVHEDGCTGCEVAVCGDGFVQIGVEACDDGNNNPDDGCDQCMSPLCGNGQPDPMEACDDGNDSNDDECTNVCQKAMCGDGYVGPGEQCDTGPNMNDQCVGCKMAGNAGCGNAMLEPNEECDPGLPIYKAVGGDLCSDGCKINSCFRLQNTMLGEISGNNWLDTCADADGEKVVVMILDEAKQVVYMAHGDKPAWTQNNLTAGVAPPASEYNAKFHTKLVTLEHVVPPDALTDRLMITSKIAAQPVAYQCHTSLGDGYGIAIYPTMFEPVQPHVLVMGKMGGQSMSKREIIGFDDSTELSRDLSGMDVCGAGVKPFLGTFILSVL